MPSNSVVLVRKTGNRKWNVSQSLHHVDGEPLKVPPFYVYPHMRRDICSSLKALVPKRLGGKRNGCTLTIIPFLWGLPQMLASFCASLSLRISFITLLSTSLSLRNPVMSPPSFMSKLRQISAPPPHMDTNQ